MKQLGLQYFTDIHLTVLGLLIFFSYFAFMTFQVYRQDPKEIKHLENIPFNQKD